MDEGEQKNEQLVAPSPFRIWLHGVFRVERYKDDRYEIIRTAEWGGSSYPRLLLKALLTCPGRRARREALMEMLWPELDFEQAVQNLNTATTKLRGVLRPAHERESLLMTEETSYALADQSLLWVDTEISLELIKRAEQMGRFTSDALPLLKEAGDYFNRGVFLEGEEGLWVLSRRATLDRARYRCQLWLADAYEQHGREGLAEYVLSTLLEHDPIDEDVLCRLMELLQRQGMTHQALLLYEQACTVFAEEEIDLAETTKELATQLRSHNNRTQTAFVRPSLTNDQNPNALFLSQWSEHDIIEAREWRERSGDQDYAYAEKDAMDKKRRELFHLLSSTGMAFALPMPKVDWERIKGALTRPSRIDETVLRHLETINGSLWSLYLATPIKSSVFEGALGQFKTLLQLLKDPHPTAQHQRLCTLTSEIGQLVGEIFFDLDDHEAARSCYALAALSAKDAQSYDLWSCALVRNAFLPMYRGEYKDALPLLQGAWELSQQGDSSLPTCYWVAAVEAEAHAGVLDLADCQHALERAQGVHESKERSLPWVRFSSTRLPALLGACSVRLRQPEQAMSALQEALQTFVYPSRKRGMVLIDLASASMQVGEAEQAYFYVDEITQILAQSSSGFLREELRRLPQRLELMAQKASVEAVNNYIGERLRFPRA